MPSKSVREMSRRERRHYSLSARTFRSLILVSLIISLAAILFGFLLSFFIEFAQLFMDRQTDLYDLIMNTAGAAIGYLIFIAITRLKKKSKD